MARKQPTSRDVARLAGVSRTTVSLVLNNAPDARISDETRQRVLEAARKLNYHPTAAARSLVSGRTQRIGMILAEGEERLSSDAFWPGYLRGVTAAARQRGYRLLLQTAEDVLSREACTSLMREKQVDGLILSGPRVDDPLLPWLADEGFPLVLHGYLPDMPFPCVDVDNHAGGWRATDHLASLGHRRIAFISNAPLRYASARDRLNGYRQALQEHGLPFESDYTRTTDFSPEMGKEAMESLLALPSPPSAVFVAGDVVALGAIDAVFAAGLRVPDDVAIVGFDDLFIAAYARPPLTTVRVPTYDLGWTAAQVLINRIADSRNVSSVILETELIVRESCGAKALASRDQ